MRGRCCARCCPIFPPRSPDPRGEVVVHPLPVLRAPQLAQLFQNLVGNALKFHREGVPPSVVVASWREGEAWGFSVRDAGIGIAPECRERVFQIFQRLHTRQEQPGSGIGFAICKKIVDGHGGRIWVEPAEGGGNDFRFTIPDPPAADPG